MLRVTSLRSGAAGYYLSDLASEVAVVRPDGRAAAAGTFVGAAAEPLGLIGPVDPDALETMLEDRGPHGRPLTATVTPVAAYDLTFTCPKSVSVLFGVADRHASGDVVAAHEVAVAQAMAYVEARAAAVRRGTGDERHLVLTHGVVAAAFTHGVSRALDPHLHTHVVVANFGRGEGRWSALDSRSLHAHAAAAGSLYHSHLRQELAHRLAVAWEPGPMGATPELHGVSPEVRAAFSGRSADIRRQMWDWQARSARADRLAWALTRDEKSVAIDPVALRRHWVDRASSAGLVPAAIDRVTGQRQSQGIRAVLDEHRFAAALLTSSRDGPTRRDVVSAWAGAATQGSSVRDVVGAVEAWVPAGRGLGVDEPRLAPSAVIPSPLLLRTLGPRPLSGADQQIYQSGARAIAAYRTRWNITETEHPLGVDGSPRSLAALPARQLADHLEVERSLQVVGRALGRDITVRSRDRDHGLDRGRAVGQ